MPFITTEQIQNISVRSVEMFLNEKIPLSQGLAKQASEMELNSEQIHRAVEATNSIAYLKILKMADDRTVEFPLCKYAEVMKAIVIPEDLMNKSASFIAPLPNPAPTIEQEPYVPFELSYHEYKVYLTKMAMDNEKQLNNLKDREVTIIPELIKLSSVIKADNQGLEKLATIAEGKELSMLSSLVYGEVKAVPHCGIFKKAELAQAEKLQFLLKEAMVIRSEITEKQKLADRAELMKTAVFQQAGDAIGGVIGGTIGGAGKTIGKGISNSASNIYKSLKSKVGLGAPPVTKKFGIGKVLGPAAGVAFDSALYKPGRDATTGASKDIWTALQRE